MKINRSRGGRCTHPLHVEIEDGASLTESDLEVVNTLFGDSRVIVRSEAERAEVYLYIWTSITHKPRTLRGVGYGKLIELDSPAHEETQALAKRIGREILGCDVEILSNRSPNGRAFVIAYCRLNDFIRNL